MDEALQDVLNLLNMCCLNNFIILKEKNALERLGLSGDLKKY